MDTVFKTVHFVAPPKLPAAKEIAELVTQHGSMTFQVTLYLIEARSLHLKFGILFEMPRVP